MENMTIYDGMWEMVELGTVESEQGALATIFGNATYLDSSVDSKNVEEVSSNIWRAWTHSQQIQSER